MLAAFQPPRGYRNEIRGYVAPPRTRVAGAFPRRRTLPSPFLFRLMKGSGDGPDRPPLPGGAGRRGHCSAACRWSSVRREPSSFPCSVLIPVPLSSPFREKICRRMSRAALVLWRPARHAAVFPPPALCSRSVPSGRAMPFGVPPFRRRVSHAGRERRLIMNAGLKNGFESDAMKIISICSYCLSVLHLRPRLLSERLGVVRGSGASRPGDRPVPRDAPAL